MPTQTHIQTLALTQTLSALSPEEFHALLEEQSGKQVSLKLKVNRSTMLSVRWDSRNCNQANICVHPMFLRAPRNVMEALACHLREENRTFAPEIKQFISIQSHLIPPHEQARIGPLLHQGKYFNLQALYDEVNETYFGNALKLSITWFGQHAAKNRSKIYLGLFSPCAQLVKINRILDQATTPRYVLLFIIYHEMLHSICKPLATEKGSIRIHHREFKMRERNFLHFHEATSWIAKQRSYFFV